VADNITPQIRSSIMSRVKGRNTKPERTVRKLLHAMGYRFRLHRKDLPGKPDIVLPKYQSVIFVHGCFWHGHEGCKRAARPTSNIEFWNSKLDSNIKRDAEAQKNLKEQGWKYLVIWQCEMRNLTTLQARLKQFLVNISYEQKTNKWAK
jgi:DNA mismatch endonuclease (patch repair protein)